MYKNLGDVQMKKKFRRYIMGWIASCTIALIIVFILRTFIGISTTVKGTSMIFSLYPEDKLFLSTWSTNFAEVPERGEVITFEAPSVLNLESSKNYIAIYDKNSRSFGDKVLYYSLGISKSSFIKRVIGLPGDHIEIKNNCVYINDEKYQEDYIIGAMKTDMSRGGICDDVIVPENCVYVLGDNRSASMDSRKFGCIPVYKIEGKVIWRWWPINKFGRV